MMTRVNFKITAIYLLVLLGATIGVSTLLSRNTSPDVQILGRWKEVSWTYEKVNRHKHTRELIDKDITDNVKDELAQSMFIHRAEVWEFRKDGSLILHKKGKRFERIHWKLKGYGRVLKLHYGDEKDEYYDVDAISEKNMRLYFDVEIQAKGIVRLEFKKIR